MQARRCVPVVWHIGACRLDLPFILYLEGKVVMSRCERKGGLFWGLNICGQSVAVTFSSIACRFWSGLPLRSARHNLR